MTGVPALEALDLRVSYGRVEAVRGITFDVAPGEILGFLGPNGAGKSTTIKVFTGQMDPTAGGARILGMPVRRDDPALKARIGVCFEEKNLYPDMTGLETLRFFASLFGIRDGREEDLLRRVGLADRAADRVARYSKGMKQRLMMARALVNSPDVLFLDEPTDGLDPVSSIAIRSVIREEAARGAAVLLTTHDMWEADELSDRVAFICDGTLHALDAPERLKLAHGRRRVRIRLGEPGGEVREVTVDLGSVDAGERLRDAVAAPDLLTIHTEEATLESVFVELTGRRLSA